MEPELQSARAQVKASLRWVGRLFYTLGGLLAISSCILYEGMLGQFCFFMFICLTVSNGHSALQLARARDGSAAACFVLQVVCCALLAVSYAMGMLVNVIARQAWTDFAFYAELSLLWLFLGEISLCVCTGVVAWRYLQFSEAYYSGLQPLLSANLVV